MATLTWPGIRARLAGETRAQGEGLRGVAIRLAGQTVVLLLVMLVVLEVVVYLIVQQRLQASLADTLRTKAQEPDPSLCGAYRLKCGGGGPGGPPGPQTRQHGQKSPGNGYHFNPSPSSGPFSATPAGDEINPSDAVATYVNRQMVVVHADNAIAGKLLDPEGARRAIRTDKEQCCSTHRFDSQNYLVYSMPLSYRGKIIGAVQTRISEHQYEGTMASLMQALLLVALLGLVTSGGISAILTRRALEPIRLALQRQRDFVADAAHELRTPLAIQRTIGEVAMGEPSPDELHATVEQMLGENRHLTRLVEDLSLLARTDTNAVAIERRPVDLSSLVTETVEELTSVAHEQGVSLSAQVQGDVGVTGDLLRLRQLLLILLDNALKHTPAGGRVSVRLTSHSNRSSLQVMDSGPGIDHKDLPRIFDRFYRADEARTGEGSGLGLAIARWIVERHAGQIRAANASPHGAVFSVTLPHDRRVR